MSALVRDVVVVEFHCVVGQPATPSFGAGADNDLKYATSTSSGCPRAALPRSVGKGLADRAVAGLCVYWCSIERASVREFMSSAEKLRF